MIYYNRVWSDDDLEHCFFSCLFDLVPAFAIYASSFIYIGLISTDDISKKIPIYWYELIIVIIYLIPLAILIISLIINLMIIIMSCIIGTIYVVNERNEKNLNKNCDNLENVEILSDD
jgi:uncharacterized protein (DUF983 family)